MIKRVVPAMIVWMAAAPVAAQSGATGGPRTLKWSIEVHGGANAPTNPSGGTSALPPPGVTFSTLVGRDSRRVPSWYFGDGASLLNQIAQSLFTSARITPLDDFARAPIARRRTGASVGARLTRTLSARFSVELAVDYHAAPLRLRDDATSAVEPTRASFVTAWNAILATGPFFAPLVTSKTTPSGGRGGQYVTTGVLNVALMTGRRTTPYASVGAGMISARSSAQPRVDLIGNYQFQILGAVPINETDSIHIRADTSAHRAAAVIGGGVEFAASPRWGIRVDARDLLSGNRTSTRLDAAPSVAMGTPVFTIASLTTPSLQFSTASGATSTLSGSAIQGFQTFKVTGIRHDVSIAGGVFWRF
ncbi:MAG: hypothetical protein DMF86_05380 [Acidobacteria bacterium]|nr:MAG: hypothetical protein DMF86_05380 [Acidobacteriota bacterium]